MILKATILLATVFVQVLSQGQAQYQQPQQYNPFTPQSWYPYGGGSHNWMDYINKAAAMSQQFYKQWEKNGGSDMIAAGMGYAQQWAKEAQKAAEAAMKQAQAQGGALGGYQ